LSIKFHKYIRVIRDLYVRTNMEVGVCVPGHCILIWTPNPKLLHWIQDSAFPVLRYDLKNYFDAIYNDGSISLR